MALPDPASPTAGAADGPTFALDEDQELIRQEVRRFAEERLLPGTAERDREHRFPAEQIREMGELGLLGMLVDPRHGGGGADVLSYLVAVEELARICPSTAVTMSVTNSVCCWPIDRFGSEELKARVLPSLAGRRDHRRLRPHRARLGERRRRLADDRGA